MASYGYTRNLTEDDLKTEVHVYTKKELWENWWDYNLRWVIIGTIVLAVTIYFIFDTWVFNTQTDYQLAIISPYSITQDVKDEMTETLTAHLDDITGDGKVTVSVVSYAVDLSNYTMDDVAIDAAINDTVPVTSPNPEELDEADFNTNAQMDYYAAMAGQVQMASDIETAETNIFILYDPEHFQLYSEMLSYPDGSMPEDPATVNWQELVHAVPDCNLLSENTKTALGDYYIARRGTESDPDVLEKVSQYQGLWDMLTEGVPTAAQSAAQ